MQLHQPETQVPCQLSQIVEQVLLDSFQVLLTNGEKYFSIVALQAGTRTPVGGEQRLHPRVPCMNCKSYPGTMWPALAQHLPQGWPSWAAFLMVAPLPAGAECSVLRGPPLHGRTFSSIPRLYRLRRPAAPQPQMLQPHTF